MRLANQTAVVTGASRGIGRAIALRLARDGASLVLGYRADDAAAAEVEAACTALGRRVALVRGDLSDPATVPALFQAADQLGGLDILVNNAAMALDGLLATQSEDEWERMLAVNIRATVAASRAALQRMIPKRTGSIVNLSSVVASRPGPGNAVYAGTKGFVEAFTRALAVEVGRKGVRVNAVAPGIVSTDMSAGVRALASDRLIERTALRRFGGVDEIADVVSFLACAEAAYITGAIVAVDGGQS